MRQLIWHTDGAAGEAVDMEHRQRRGGAADGTANWRRVGAAGKTRRNKGTWRHEENKKKRREGGD